MELIDKDFIKKLGGKCIAERDEKTLELLPIIGIDGLPTVDAIPVQWLYDLAEKKEEEKDIKLSLMIKGVVALWHREKQNESY